MDNVNFEQMRYLFIRKEVLFWEVKAMLEAFERAGYDTDNMRLGQSWHDFLSEVPDHSTIIVYSVDFFSSLMELLGTLAELQERGITLKSLQEPWLSSEMGSTAEFLLKLRELAVLLHQNRTREGLEKARAQGKKLGRPAGYSKPLRKN